MRLNRTNITVWAAVSVTAALFLALLGCESSGGGFQPTPVGAYKLAGTLVGNPGRVQTQVAVELTRNDSILASGMLRFETDTLSDTLEFADTSQFADSIYFFSSVEAYRYTGDSATLQVSDPNRFTSTFSLVVPDTFSITSVIPATGQWRPTDGPVQLVWNGSDGADGYILAAVKHQAVYTGGGYSAYADELSTAGNIPGTAFYTNAGATLDTGLYNIYVYAYSGSPDKNLADQILPVPLPTQLGDNIDQRDLTGRFGALTLAMFDTLRVIQQ